MKQHILDAIRADGLVYFIFHFKYCMAHCRNQKRLADNAKDPIRQAAIAKYVDALYANADLK
jgi:hypothetical protein